EERKALEHKRDSAMDDVPTGQPALALAQKVIARAQQAGVPSDLIPSGMLTITVSADVDAENALRSEVLAFMDDVRSAEKAIAAGAGQLDGAQPGTVTEEQWRAAWPTEVPDELTPDELAHSNNVEPQ
ncbi:MAG TPA: nucleoside triphosphate pyrophosphohydrolase, partial [Mycobacterium sp.]